MHTRRFAPAYPARTHGQGCGRVGGSGSRIFLVGGAHRVARLDRVEWFLVIPFGEGAKVVAGAALLVGRVRILEAVRLYALLALVVRVLPLALPRLVVLLLVVLIQAAGGVGGSGPTLPIPYTHVRSVTL